VTDTTRRLADAMNALIASLDDHPVLKGVAGIDAAMDLEAYEAAPHHGRGVRDMVRSAEDLVDDLRISKLPETPELVAAEKALEACLLA